MALLERAEGPAAGSTTPPPPRVRFAVSHAVSTAVVTLHGVLDDRGGELRPEGMGVRGGPGGVEFTVAYRPGPGGGKPVRLVYTVSRSVAVEVPFALRNVPLP